MQPFYIIFSTRVYSKNSYCSTSWFYLFDIIFYLFCHFDFMHLGTYTLFLIAKDAIYSSKFEVYFI